MEYSLPQINMWTREQWSWPFYKFGLEREELFTTLHDRFNMHQLPLQDPMAFHRDVCESAHYAATLEEFYSQMEERRAERIKEMNKAWRNVRLLIVTDGMVLACPLCYDPETATVRTKPGTLNDSVTQRWHLFNYFSRTPSFDTLIRFFDGFVRDSREKDERIHGKARERFRKWREEQAAKRAAAAAEATEGSTRSPPEAAHSQPETSHYASSPDAPSDRPRRPSTRRRHGTATPSSTTANSTTRKRRSDEDTQGPQRKRRRATSESAGEDDDAVWFAAEHDRSEAEEPASTTRQAEKRKRPDDYLDEQRIKRPRRYSSDLEGENESLHQYGSSDEQENEWSSPSSDEEEEDGSLRHYDALDGQEKKRPRGYSSDFEEEHESLHHYGSLHEQENEWSRSSSDEEEEDGSLGHYDALDEQENKPPRRCSFIHFDLEEKSKHSRQLGITPSEYERILLDNRHPHFKSQEPEVPSDQWPMFPRHPMSTRSPSLDSYHTCHEAAEAEEAEAEADSGHIEEAQTSPQEDAEGHSGNDTTNAAANAKKKREKSRALRRQRVEQRRSSEEPETSPPKKQPRRKKRQERMGSAAVEHLLQSKRSSRRSVGQPLFFLGDDATACVANGKRRI
ncbi:hypothetical protein J3F83DRAFT_49468 [Trichoderma novae-zelandiae]